MSQHRKLGFLALIALLALCLVASFGAQSITIPNTFTNGTTADASQVNANFSALSSNALNRTGGTMTGTLNSRDVTPTSDATYDIGTTLLKFRDAWFSRNVAAGGTLGVTGNTTLGGTLGVTGATTHSGTSAHTGASTFASTMDVTGVATFSSADSTFKAGASTETVKPMGAINVDTTGVGTPASTADTLLFNYTLPASALNDNSRTIRITAWGQFGATANNKTVRIKWNNAGGLGGTTAVTGTTATNGSAWILQAMIFRLGSNSQMVLGWGFFTDSSSPTPAYTTAAATDTGAITIGVTSQNGTAAVNDCVYLGSTIEFIN